MPDFDDDIDDDINDEEYERRRVKVLCDHMSEHLFAVALALKRARCMKAFRSFRTALSNADAFDCPDSSWIVYPETNRVIKEELVKLPKLLGKDKRRNPDERRRILYYSHSIRQLWSYFRGREVSLGISDFRYLDREAANLIEPFSP